ncbi:MAG: TMEM175 family protein [Gemmatimonadales bacterium]
MRPSPPTEANPNARLEAFSDGVFAIALTLLIIDVKLPGTESIADTADFWRALQRLSPTVLAFVLSFGVVLIAWVNHHAALKLVGRSSAAFIYANGFLLLTVVFIPFPTSLLGAFILTDHAAPAVVVYDAVLAVQSFGWVLLSGAALKGQLTKDEQATATLRKNRVDGYSAVGLYSLLSLAAVWFPLTAATITALTWVFWLAYGLRAKHA